MLKIIGLVDHKKKCVCCGAEISDGVACPSCMGLIDSPKDYSFNDFSLKGKQKKNTPGDIWGFGIEIETYSVSPEQLVLYSKGFVPCYDSSVALEWKSPIFQNLVGFKQICKKIEDLNLDHAGSHVHISVTRKDLFINYYDKIFHPLAEFLSGTSYWQVWGRDENQYCELPGSADERYSWACVDTRYQTLEWRLPRFVSAEQYYALVKWLTKATWTIDQKLRANKKPQEIGRWLLDSYCQEFCQELAA